MSSSTRYVCLARRFCPPPAWVKSVVPVRPQEAAAEPSGTPTTGSGGQSSPSGTGGIGRAGHRRNVGVGLGQRWHRDHRQRLWWGWERHRQLGRHRRLRRLADGHRRLWPPSGGTGGSHRQQCRLHRNRQRARRRQHQLRVVYTPSMNFDMATSLAAFQTPLYPILQANCLGCHNTANSLGNGAQPPVHSDQDVNLAHQYALTQVEIFGRPPTRSS